MANHARHQIRDQVVSTLTGLTTTGARVYPSRVRPLTESNYPCLLVYTTSEAVVDGNGSRPRSLVRQLRLVVEAVCKASADIDDTLDTIAKEVEVALATDPTLGGLAKDCVLAETEIDLVGDGDKPHGIGKLTFSVVYCTKENTPDTPM